MLFKRPPPESSRGHGRWRPSARRGVRRRAGSALSCRADSRSRAHQAQPVRSETSHDNKALCRPVRLMSCRDGWRAGRPVRPQSSAGARRPRRLPPRRTGVAGSFHRNICDYCRPARSRGTRGGYVLGAERSAQTRPPQSGRLKPPRPPPQASPGAAHQWSAQEQPLLLGPEPARLT